jgi:nitrite reductase (NO-forming)
MVDVQQRPHTNEAHQPPRQQSSPWFDLLWAFIAAVAVLALVLAVVGLFTPKGGKTTVTSAAPANVATPAAAPGTPQIDPNATPGADWKPFDPTLQPAPGGTEHKIDLSAEETTKEIAPGITQEVWTFNGQTPGPVLHGKVGDTFTVTLTNNGKIGHSIDFHASQVAWSDEMRTINPGESLVYQFKAEYAGIWMYHCGTAPTLHHIGNGMFGAVIIDPPDLKPVDHEYVMVQSELYLGANGGPGDLARMKADQWDAVVFNGYYDQYKFSPIRVEPNQRIRVWVLDAGPSENSSFHVVGSIFDTVFMEGHYVLQPGNSEQGGSQSLALQPAQGGFVEFSLAETGFYPMVTHKFSNAAQGALGLFQAGDAKMPAGASH